MKITEAPLLRSERLVLRPHRADDLDAVAAMWGDERVVRYISGTPSTRNEAWSRVLRYAGLWHLLGYGYWAVEANGVFVGEVGLADFQRPVTPPLTAPEAGWVFAASAHGQGCATEAVSCMLRWADETLAAPETVCLFNPDHAASLRVAAKCGYGEPVEVVFEGTAAGARPPSAPPGGKAPAAEGDQGQRAILLRRRRGIPT